MSQSTAAVSPQKNLSRKYGQKWRKETLTGWMFLGPFALLFILTFLVPIISAVVSSFYQTKATGGGLYGGGESVEQFVGFDNYLRVISSDTFWLGIGRVVLFGIFQIPIMIIMALALALLLDSFMVRRVGGYRLGYFMPYAIPGIIAAMVWVYLYQPSFSPIVKALAGAGINIDFFDPSIILASMANMTTWTYTGYNMLIFLAALQAVPHDLYEAARIDGCTGFQIVRKIKIPMVRNAALLAVLLSIIGTIQLFNEPAVLLKPNPWMGDAYTPMMMAYNTMMGSLSPGGNGPASAISIVMALIAGLLAVVYAMLQKKAD